MNNNYNNNNKNIYDNNEKNKIKKKIINYAMRTCDEMKLHHNIMQ